MLCGRTGTGADCFEVGKVDGTTKDSDSPRRIQACPESAGLNHSPRPVSAEKPPIDTDLLVRLYSALMADSHLCTQQKEMMNQALCLESSECYGHRDMMEADPEGIVLDRSQLSCGYCSSY